MAESYNKIFKRHYNINFGKEYVIHHIDGNHSNDEISNLLLLPRWLHSKYHILKAVIDNHPLATTISGNQANQGNYYLGYYKRFIAVLEECNKWYDFKMYLDGNLPNIHGIEI